MNSSKHFNSQILSHGGFAVEVKNNQIKNEPMFFNSGLNFAWENGGPITRSFIENLPEKFLYDAVFDSRVHMLMPDWYPAIPGYHHDDVPRPDVPVGTHFAMAGQPDYDSPRYLSSHILGLVGADVCPTHFALGECEMPKVEDGETIYRVWHPEVVRLLDEGKLQRFQAPDRTLIEFDWQTFHSGSKAVKHGWLWFGRVSINTDRAKTLSNEIRVNAQVYLEHPMMRW